MPYYAISDDALTAIIKRVTDNHQAGMTYSNPLVEAVLARCTEVDSGARNVDNLLNATLLPEIAGTVLTRMAEGGEIRTIKSGEFTCKIT